MKNYFSTNLKALLMKHEMSQTELATRLGVKPQAVSRYISGTIFPSIDILIGMCEVFGYTLDELVRYDLTTPDFVLKKPLTEYEKAENVDNLIRAFEKFTADLKSQRQTSNP